MATTSTTPAGAASVYGRNLKRWEQKDLAEALTAETGRPWTKQKVSRMERGEYEPRHTELLALAAVLDLPTAFVLHGAGHMAWYNPHVDGSEGREVPHPALATA